MTLTTSQLLSGLMGVCVGDALGVSVEFTPRRILLENPVIEMQGFGTYNQPPGTWSDDSSLTFCLAEAMCEGVSPTTELLARTGDNFCRWYESGFWTPHGVVFDIGNATARAIRRLQAGVSPTEAGGTDETSNGNGSLMRILPVAFAYDLLDFPQLIELAHQISCLTHAHPRSQIGCSIYISIAVCLLQGKQPHSAYLEAIQQVVPIYAQPPYASEKHHFQRVLAGNIATLSLAEIRSSGYVVDSLEAALWCFLNSTSYSEAVLKAVNLGEDTDTTAAITGGLAGIYYGRENIPSDWSQQIARQDEIIDLASRLQTALTVSC
ncbi:ADP-ribosylglycohydrolase family protein [Oscillatoria salina]|uniref:ADP-ribosylglycohydrolase family protein n=1 Tax=Oscillatoria salina TaxID=331517 RepID=UPI001CCCC495|nr:ADP-ribosylglycohydrolase family protein [Oscillatoria salina]MBZ8182688.1 ADP-ribosylglycohydrolase family protein [Oscillatoria salina IIICB1]